MKHEEKIVMRESDEAAKLVTVTGWVDRHGRFFGDDERTARYSGSTHFTCGCGNVAPKGYTICSGCREKSVLERYLALPKAPWDGVSMLAMFDDDTYFTDMEEAEEYAETNEMTLEGLRLVICEPQIAERIDPNEHYHDKLPEDGEVPADIADAFEELNKKIEASKAVLSWQPGKVAVDINAPLPQSRSKA
jgi:hypothetical protein